LNYIQHIFPVGEKPPETLVTGLSK